jgi:RNA polymerase sigma-54 factor
MTINQRLDLKQSQTLTMTPQLQQAIKLLQMSNIELAEFVEAELEKNPLLERDDSMRAEAPASEEPTPAAENPGEDGDEGVFDTDAPTHDDSFPLESRDDGAQAQRQEDPGQEYAASETEHGDAAADMALQDGGYDAFATDGYAGLGAGGNLKFEDSDSGFENTLEKKGTLREYLTEQIALEFEDPREQAAAIVLLDALDDSGYFRADLASIAKRLGLNDDKALALLQKLQALDPPGVFARSLAECLGLQLRDKNRLDPAMQKLLDNLDLLGAHDLKKLKSVCGVDDDDLKDMIGEIRSLNPKPATDFEPLVVQTVVPDVLMRPLPKSKGGGWAVELNNDTLPRVLINKKYYAEISQSARAKKDKEYLSEQMGAANWLIKAMHQRAETILKTASEIILQQENFFLYGVEFLKPLTLKDISAAISMHESTVSRVTTGKYIGTPRGVFELKYFFTSSVVSSEGAAVSSESVKSRIGALIAAETPDAVLSDDDLVDLLKNEGIDIARRTVAKYREALKIASSVQRRRQKKT